MRLPGVCGDKSGTIVRLKRTLYGLKQSGRQWANLLAETLVKYGLEQCKADPCVFRKVAEGRVEMIVGVYVDDIMVAGSIEACGRLHAGLNKEFPTNDLGELTYYTGCAFERDWELGTIKVSQGAYVESIVKRFNVQTTSPIPASPGADVGPKKEDEPIATEPFREAVGCLMWGSTMTRPDITNAVRAVARQAHAPTARLWSAITKTIADLHGTKDLGITYVRGSGLDLEVYADADYADKANDRRSVSGVAVTLGGTCCEAREQDAVSCLVVDDGGRVHERGGWS